MAQYIGLTNRDVALKAQSDLIANNKRIIEEFNKNLDTLLNSEPTFLEKAMGVFALPFASQRAIIKGGLNGVVDAALAMITTGVRSINSFIRAFDNSDGTTAGQDIGMMLWTPVIDTARSVASTGFSIADTLSKFSPDKKFAAVVGALSDYADDETIKFFDELQVTASGLGSDMDKLNKFGGVQTKEETEKKNSELLAKYYSDLEGFVKNSTSTQKWIKQNVVAPASEIFSFGMAQNADTAFGDEKIYQAFVSSSESMGNILMSMFLAKAGAKIGLNPSVVSNVYFASSVFGKSFVDAIDNGVTIDDAYTYATGNALIETAVEGTFGFKPTGAADNLISKVMEKVTKANWGILLSNALGEGIEEVMSDIATPMLGKYANEDEKLTRQEFAEQAFFSFLGGAFASVGLSGGQVYFDAKTAEGKLSKISKELSREVNDENASKVVEKLKDDIGETITLLNTKNAKGIKTHEKGYNYVGKLTEQEKIDFVENSGLSKYIKFENGVFSATKDTYDLSASTFKNRIGNEKIKNSDYAMSDSVKAKDISLDSTIKPLKAEEQSEKGKKVIELANKRGTDVVLYKAEAETSGFYSRKNGIIYINQNSIENSTTEQIEKVLLTHELTHKISSKDPALFNKLQEKTLDLFDIVYDKESKKIELKFKNPEIGKYFESTGIESQLVASLKELERRGYSKEKTLEMFGEEIVAYFVENLLGETDFIEKFSIKNKSLVEKIKDIFDKDEDLKKFFGENKSMFKLASKFKKSMNSALKRIDRSEKTLGVLLNYAFGIENKKGLELIIKDEFLAKYTIEEISYAIANSKDGIVDLDGEKLNLKDLFKTDTKIFGNENLKRIEPPNWAEISSRFVFKSENVKKYTKWISDFSNEKISFSAMLQIQSEKLLKEGKKDEAKAMLEDSKESRRIGNLADDIYWLLKDKKTDKDKEFIDDEEKLKLLVFVIFDKDKTGENFTPVIQGEQKATKKEKKTVLVDTKEMIAVYNAIQKVRKFLIENTSFVDTENSTVKNHARSSEDAGHALYIFTPDAGREDEHVDIVRQAIEVTVNAIYPQEFEVEGELGLSEAKGIPANKVGKIYIRPRKEFIEKEVEILRIKEQKEQLLGIKEIQSGENTKTLKYLDDKVAEYAGEEKYFSGIIGQNSIGFVNEKLQSNKYVGIFAPTEVVNGIDFQNGITSTAKLIYVENLGVVKGVAETEKRSTKTTIQIWERDSELEDLRISQKEIVNKDDFDTKILPHSKETFEKAKERFNFAFGVLYRGNSKTDFNQKFFSLEGLSYNQNYMLFNPRTDESLGILEQIDFNELANASPNKELFFSTREVYLEYDRLKEANKKLTEQLDSYNKRIEADSEGNILTPQQVELFKDSKARDEQGRLLRLYHGTQNSIRQKTGTEKIGDDVVKTREFRIGNSFLKIFENSPFAQGRNSVYDFYVDENLRRQGIGTSLLNEATKQYDVISAQVSNENSIKTHYKAGFRLTTNPNNSVDQIIEEWKTGPGSVNMEYRKDISNENPTADPDILKHVEFNSNGDIVSEEISKYFKDTVIRDKYGRLLIVYHGTPKGGFRIFDTNRGTHWFTDNYVESKNYSTGEDRFFTEKEVEARQKIFDFFVKEKYEQIRSTGTFEEMNEFFQKAKPVLLTGKLDSYNKNGLDAEIVKDGETYSVHYNYANDFNNSIFNFRTFFMTTRYKVSRPSRHEAIVSNVTEKQAILLMDVLITNLLNDEQVAAGTYPSYLNVKNPLIIEGKNQAWDELKVEKNIDSELLEFLNGKSKVKTDDFAIFMKNSTKYDGLIIKDVYDGSFVPINVYVVKDSSQIKSIYNQNPSMNPDIFKRVNTPKETNTPLDYSQIKDLHNEFGLGEDVIKSFFTRRKDGSIVVKNSKNPVEKIKHDSVRINGVTVNEKTHAIHIPINMNSTDITISSISEKDIIRMNDLENNKIYKKQKLFYDFLKSMDIPFVLYKNNGNVMGFSHSEGFAINDEFSTSDLVGAGAFIYINANYMINSCDVAITFVHEAMHEFVKFTPKEAFAMGAIYANLFFELDSATNKMKPTQIQEAALRRLGGVDLFYKKYMAKGYDSSFANYTFDDIYNALISPTHGQLGRRAVNELIAQFTGFIFSDQNIFLNILKSDKNVIPMMNIYNSLLNVPNLNSNFKTVLSDLLSQYKKTFEGYKKKLEAVFPDKYQKIYSLKDLNKFIKDFTSGEYSTKSDLFNDYVKEKKNGKKEKASIIVDNIIFIASKLGETITNSENVFNSIKEEFVGFKDTIEYLLDSDDNSMYFSVTRIVKLYKIINQKLKILSKNLKAGVKNTEEFYDEINKAFEEFKSIYCRIVSRVLSIFGIPEFSSIENIFDELFDKFQEVEEGEVTDTIKTELIKEFDTRFDMFTKALGDKLARKKEQNAYIKLILLKQNLQSEKYININQTLKNGFKNVWKSITKQSEAQPNDNLILLNKLMNGIISAVAKTETDINEIENSVIPILDQIYEFIRTSKYIPDYMDEEIGKAVINLYYQFAILAKDKSILLEKYPDAEGFAARLDNKINKFNPSSILASFSRILRAFQTVYKNVYSSDGMTTEDYSAKIIDQINQLKESKKMDNRKQFYVENPQHFFKKFAEVFGDDVELFRDVWNQYFKSATRRMDILMEFDHMYQDFNKKNEIAQKRSLEIVNISQDFLSNISSDEISKMKDQIKGEVDFMKSELKTRREEKSDTENDIRAVRVKIKEINEKMKFTSTKIKDYQLLKAEKEYLETELASLRDKKKRVVKEIDVMKSELSNYSEEFEMKKRMIEYLQDEKNKDVKQKITMGSVYEMILSLRREIEMEEMADNGEAFIAPTDHWAFGNTIQIFDPEVARYKGYDYAKTHTTPFVIFALRKQDLLKYLESLLTSEIDNDIINFAQNTFDYFYNKIDEIYYAKNGVHLLKQPTYFPFKTTTSALERTFKLKKANSFNAGVADGFVMQTMTGARTPLQFSNIFDTIENYAVAAANYSFERVTSDFWAVMSFSGNNNQTLEAKFIDEKNKIGSSNKYIDFFESAMLGILQYKDKTESPFDRLLKQVLSNTVSAKVALTSTMFLKQFASIVTISFVCELDFMKLIKNTTLSMGRSKYRDWLRVHNSNFRHRERTGNIPNLSEQFTPASFRKRGDKVTSFWGLLYWINNKLIKKPVDFLGRHVGWADNAIIVGAFKTICDQIREENLGVLTEEEVLEKANERLYDVLLFGVANTDTAFRAKMLTSNDLGYKLFSRFQSENILQISNILRAYSLKMNKVAGADKKLREAIVAFLLSAIMSAVVTVEINKIRGNEEDGENGAFNLAYETIWSNMIGSIPFINQVTSLFRFSLENSKFKIGMGYSPEVPFLTQLYKIAGALDGMTAENALSRTKKILENFGDILGIPTKNLNKIISTVARLLGEGGNAGALEMSEFFQGKTKGEMLNEAISDKNKAKINAYVDMQYDNIKVMNELARVVIAVDNSKLNLHNVKSFIKEDEDGNKITYKIPSDVREKYNGFTEKALLKLITKSDYRRLSDEEKLKAIQRVINYYYNKMKLFISDDKEEKKKKELTFEEVAELSLRYSEEEKKGQR